MLRLYDIENGPHCRLVREVLTELDLDAEIYPCPKQGKRFRPVVVELRWREWIACLLSQKAGAESMSNL